MIDPLENTCISERCDPCKVTHMHTFTYSRYNIFDVDKIRINGMTTSKSFTIDQLIESSGKILRAPPSK